MGPFGIAAVGLLSKKGSGAKKNSSNVKKKAEQMEESWDGAEVSGDPAEQNAHPTTDKSYNLTGRKDFQQNLLAHMDTRIEMDGSTGKETSRLESGACTKANDSALTAVKRFSRVVDKNSEQKLQKSGAKGKDTKAIPIIGEEASKGCTNKSLMGKNPMPEETTFVVEGEPYSLAIQSRRPRRPGLNRIKTGRSPLSVRTVQCASDMSADCPCTIPGECTTSSGRNWQPILKAQQEQPHVRNDLSSGELSESIICGSDCIEGLKGGFLKLQGVSHPDTTLSRNRSSSLEEKAPSRFVDLNKSFESGLKNVRSSADVNERVSSRGVSKKQSNCHQSQVKSRASTKSSSRMHNGSISKSEIAKEGTSPASLKGNRGGRNHACPPSSGVPSNPVSQNETAELTDNLKETESPRFRALLRMTGGVTKKKAPTDITSFSMELGPGVFASRSSWQLYDAENSEALMDALQARFNDAKKGVDTELAVFAADLLDILESDTVKQDSELRVKQEDLLILARECSMMSAEDFREQCEGIVQKLDDERQKLPVGRLKLLHTRMLFILTRCTRLLQYQKENDMPKDKLGLRDWKSGVLRKKIISATPKDSLSKRYYSQEQSLIDSRNSDSVTSSGGYQNGANEMLSEMSDPPKESESSFKKKLLKMFNTEKLNLKSSSGDNSSSNKPPLASHKPGKVENEKYAEKKAWNDVHAVPNLKDLEVTSKDRTHSVGTLARQQRISRTNSDDQSGNSNDIQLVICRICEDGVPTFHLEEHSRICALAVRCDAKGVAVDDRLCKLAEILGRIVDLHTPNSSHAAQGESPDTFRSCAFNEAVCQGVLPKLSECYVRDSEDSPEDHQEMDTASMGAMSFKSLFGSKSEHSRASSSVGSITPRSPQSSASYFDLQLAERASLGESEDSSQISELADIARCVASTVISEDGALEYLVSCLQDLQDILQESKFEALIIHTFGKRIEKLLREKYFEICESSKGGAADSSTYAAVDESNWMEEDSCQHVRPAPGRPLYKDRTSIDDFAIIKPISRGAFGRVFLARKRTTGDLFAIKVLRKADMIRKNAVESILAERDILISTCNPFVVRFFYSFTCRENLYLVMEYLIGGDLYSLLRNVGCLDESICRIYIAELVLALEYLHSLGVVHRDLKPDNLLIAHDGHLKLTDFGLSKVGLINSTDDLSGPAACGTIFPNGYFRSSQVDCEGFQQRERRQKRSAVGTPDYLAPEILLGTRHGSSADWWSTGVILFECLTGVPPFNAEHPQRIFDNILNRRIPWPQIPEYMSYNAKDLIDKLLTEDPSMRLGAKGAAEVKMHPFFKDVNWDTLAKQKAAFVPNPESPHDTSYFMCRHIWNASEGISNSEHVVNSCESVNSNSEASNFVSSRMVEPVDEPGELVEFASSTSSRFSFSNFSFKNLSQLASINYDLLMQNGKETFATLK